MDAHTLLRKLCREVLAEQYLSYFRQNRRRGIKTSGEKKQFCAAVSEALLFGQRIFCFDNRNDAVKDRSEL